MVGAVIVSLDDQYLLLLSCSQRKHSNVALLPAIERYDGGTYRLLRKAQREGRFPTNLDVLILSAKYGLITASTCILDYDQRMNRERAAALKPEVTQELQNIAEQNVYNEIYVELGQNYLYAIEALSNIFDHSTIVYAQGRIGERLAKLKQWLVDIKQANVVCPI